MIFMLIHQVTVIPEQLQPYPKAQTRAQNQRIREEEKMKEIRKNAILVKENLCVIKKKIKDILKTLQ